MQNNKLKRIIKLSAIASFAVASISVAKTSMTSTLELDEMKKQNSQNINSPINTSINYPYLNVADSVNNNTNPSYVDNLKQIMLTKPHNEIPAIPTNIPIPLILNPQSIDKFIDSIATLKKSPDEIAFDKALSTVLLQKKDTTFVDSYLLKATAWQESRFINNAVSGKGAIGLMQQMKDTYLTFRPHDKFPEDAYIPENNLSAGRDYYLFLVDYINNNHPKLDTLTKKDIVDLAIVAYNSGHGAFTHTFVKDGEKIIKKLKPENEQWRIEFMPKESRIHLTYVDSKINELKSQDKLTELAKEYKIRKEQFSLNNAFYNKNQI